MRMEDCESVSGSGSVCGFTALNPRIRLLISDLDNTLYDWLSFFVPSFYAMVDVAASELGVDRERLLDELRAVHRHYGSSEHPYALLETQTVKARYGWATPAQRKEILDPAFKAFNAARKAMLRLYPSVSEGLRAIRLSGTRVVAYTESVVYNVVHRLELLQVLDQIDFVYAPSGRGGLGSVLGQPPRRPLPMHKIRLLPPDHRKPNPAVLLSICREQDADPAATLYVGDSLIRDIAMANRAGVRSAWARYGAPADQSLWHRLVRVTHWTEADVADEARLRNECRDAKPDVEIDSFADLLRAFDFGTIERKSA